MAALALPTFMATQQLTFGLYFLGAKNRHEAHHLTVYLNILNIFIYIYYIYISKYTYVHHIRISNMHFFGAHLILNSQKVRTKPVKAAKSSLHKFALLASPHVYCGWRCMHRLWLCVNSVKRNKKQTMHLLILNPWYQLNSASWNISDTLRLPVFVASGTKPGLFLPVAKGCILWGQTFKCRTTETSVCPKTRKMEQLQLVIFSLHAMHCIMS